MSYLKLAEAAAEKLSHSGLVETAVEHPKPTQEAPPRIANTPTAQQIAAMRLLNLAGCRIIRQGSAFLIGTWQDLDGPELRNAIRLVGMREYPVIHLETANVDAIYKVRRCPERRPDEPFSAWQKRAEQAKPELVAIYAEVPA